MPDVLIVVLVVLGAGGLLALWGRHNANRTWSATVESVEEVERPSAIPAIRTTCVRVHYRRDDGRRGTCEASAVRWIAAGGVPRAGRRLVKPRGAWLPTVMEEGASAPPASSASGP